MIPSLSPIETDDLQNEFVVYLSRCDFYADVTIDLAQGHAADLRDALDIMHALPKTLPAAKQSGVTIDFVSIDLLNARLLVYRAGDVDAVLRAWVQVECLSTVRQLFPS